MVDYGLSLRGSPQEILDECQVGETPPGHEKEELEESRVYNMIYDAKVNRLIGGHSARGY